MKYASVILAAILLGSCSAEVESPITESVPVMLRVGADGDSRAVVEEWNDTTVSLAYHIGDDTPYANSVDVLVKSNSDQTIHMGFQYPDDEEIDVFVRGYYPAAKPDASGVVHYDLSLGDVDLMSTGEVSGNIEEPIIDDSGKNLLFKHRLTRLTFNLSHKLNSDLEIAAVLIFGEDGESTIPTQAELHLSDGEVIYSSPGVITVGYDHNGLTLPMTLEAMVVPDTRLTIKLLGTDYSLTEVSLASSTSLIVLETAGGEAGKQYTINLSF